MADWVLMSGPCRVAIVLDTKNRATGLTATNESTKTVVGTVEVNGTAYSASVAPGETKTVNFPANLLTWSPLAQGHPNDPPGEWNVPVTLKVLVIQ